MYRWLLVALAGYIIYRMFKNDIKAKVEERKADDAQSHAAGEMARDPICGTFVDMTDAITVRNGDKRYYFCGYDCRDTFLKRMQSGESPDSITALPKPTPPGAGGDDSNNEPPDAPAADDPQGKA